MVMARTSLHESTRVLFLREGGEQNLSKQMSDREGQLSRVDQEPHGSAPAKDGWLLLRTLSSDVPHVLRHVFLFF